LGVLLERARRAFGGGPRELPPAEPYDILCTCGQRVAGFRHDHRQFAPCPVCGHVHLVMPLSAYPKPIVHETPSRQEQIPVEVVRPNRPLGLKLQIGARRASRAGARALWSLVPPARWFSPVRLLVVAMLIMIGGTVWLTIYWNRQGSLTSDIVAMRRAWTQDIEAAQFGDARTKLEQAVSAIRRFGEDSRDAREIEQLAKEVGQIADLLDRPLEEVVRARRSMSATEAEAYILETLKSPALILDATINPGAGSGSSGYRVEAIMVSDEQPIRIDVSNLSVLAALAPSQPTRVMFAARIEAIEPPTQGFEWAVKLVPDSGVLLTSVRCLEKLGWPMDDATRAVLEAQSQWVLDGR
jgi:hypothetical protein